MRSAKSALLLGLCFLFSQQTDSVAKAQVAAHKSSGKSSKSAARKISVPPIAQLLGVRVGFNGMAALERRLGLGRTQTGGHSNSRNEWRTAVPKGKIWTDGFNMNDEGYVVETLIWTAEDPSEKPDRSIPLVKRLPRGSGWLGTITLGMTEQEVLLRIKGKLPPPQKRRNWWTWKAKGFVPVMQSEAYMTWTATLSFTKKRVADIYLSCDWVYIGKKWN